MTAQPINHGEAGVQLNKRPEAAPLHAYVENGDLFIMESGRYWAFDRNRAWAEWFWCASSPIPSTQERARQIRAAMDEAYPQELAA